MQWLKPSILHGPSEHPALWAHLNSLDMIKDLPLMVLATFIHLSLILMEHAVADLSVNIDGDKLPTW